MTALRFIALPAFCFALVACENTASTNGGAPYASNYGNDGHYNPYPGQTGYAQRGALTYEKPPQPAEPARTADPYAFSTPKKTATSSSSSTSPKESIALSSSVTKKSSSGKSSTKKTSVSRYTVGKGDTLYGIARKKGTTVAKIKAANGLSGDLIRPGQSLKMP